MKVETVAYAMEDQGVALQVETAGQAVLAALNWNSSPEARQQALAYLESGRNLCIENSIHVLVVRQKLTVRSGRNTSARSVESRRSSCVGYCCVCFGHA